MNCEYQTDGTHCRAMATFDVAETVMAPRPGLAEHRGWFTIGTYCTGHAVTVAARTVTRAMRPLPATVDTLGKGRPTAPVAPVDPAPEVVYRDRRPAACYAGTCDHRMHDGIVNPRVAPATPATAPVARCGRTDSHGAHRTDDRPYWCAGNRDVITAVPAVCGAPYAALGIACELWPAHPGRHANVTADAPDTLVWDATGAVAREIPDGAR